MRDLAEATIEVEKAREERDKYKSMYEYEKRRADALQRDIDGMGDFSALVEEVTNGRCLN